MLTSPLPTNDTAGRVDTLLTEPAADRTGPKPVGKGDRIQTIDLIRGLALLGILMMNIPGFGFLWSMLPAVLKTPGTADYYAYTIVGTAFEGTMRGLFSMLFGAGMVLFTLNKRESEHGPSVADYYYRRLLWLVVFGVINAYIFMWRGDILFFYGLMGMTLYPFRRAKPIWLLGLAVLCMSIGMFRTDLWYGDMRTNRMGYLEAVKLEKAKKKPSAEQVKQKAAWEGFEKNRKADPKKQAKELRAMRGSYATVFTHLLPNNSLTEAYGTYFGGWDILMMMFIGMALLQWGFFSNKLPTSTYALTLLIGYGVGLPLSWFYVKTDLGWIQNPAAIFDTFRTDPFLVYDIRRVLLALGHASLLLLIYRANVVPWLMRALTAVGQMAFTNYLMQSIICTLFFYGYGLGYYGKLAYHQLYYVVAGVWVFQLILSPIWLRYYQFGPFEWLWRSLTYWKPQSMRRV